MRGLTKSERAAVLHIFVYVYFFDAASTTRLVSVTKP